jgi:hypothetical protein
MKRFNYILCCVIILLLSAVSSAGAIGVQPLDIKIAAKPGETVPFKFLIASTENEPANIKISMAQPVQRLDGAFNFQPVSLESFPEFKWINFTNSEFVLSRGAEREISGSVKIPTDAKGFHLFSIMVEHVSAQKTASINLSVVYVVKVEIDIDMPAPRFTSRVSDLEMVKGPKGEPNIQFKVKNSSIVPFSTNASVSIRDNLTKRLIETVELKPGFYWENRLEPVVLPDATVQFAGFPKKVLMPGKYDIQLFFRYAASGQVLLTKTIEVKDGDYVYPARKLHITQISPDIVSFSGRPGMTSVKGIKFQNGSNKPVKIILRSMEISKDYPFSIFKNATVEYQNGQEFILGPGRMAVAVIIVKLPKDAAIQGNYGLLKVLTFSADGNPEPIEQSEINLEALILGKINLSAETADLSVTRDGGKVLLSAVIKNTGNAKITPRGVIYLKDSSGKSVDSVQMAVQGENKDLLPQKLTTLSGMTNEKLVPGKYTAQVRIIEGNEEIGNTAIEFQVK